MDACVTSWSITQWVQQLRELSINTLQTPEAGPTSISNSSASTIVQPTAFTVQSHGPAVSISASSISLPHQGQASGPVQHSHNRTQLRALSPAQAAATPLAPQGRDIAYVNPKQFGRILRRRETRRNLDQELGPLVRRPYQHRSRHIHASSRVRDTNGRFVEERGRQKRWMRKVNITQTKTRTVHVVAFVDFRQNRSWKCTCDRETTRRPALSCSEAIHQLTYS